ncbi:hypothetical protein [Ornithinibacillus californiensis]|uniref:hypothetical protein n=1 Tax=Ornithinibacillus californiensis TaxID=161536 RepID=UPI00064DFF58|nr:hypothetical protein [Ornithinibacillus californiensis]
MFRKLSILLGSVLILLSACSSNTFTFSGETDNWSAELEVTQHSNDFEDQDFKLQYKGQDVSSVGEITFTVDTNAGGFSRSGDTLNENGFIQTSKQANPTNAKIIENAEIEVTVEWNGSKESFILVNN